VVWQVVVGVLVSLGVAWIWGANAAVSAAYGALAVVLPSALMVWGVLRPRWADSATSVVRRFAVWELGKLGLTVAMLVMAPRWIGPVNWLALVAGFVVTMKVLGVAAWLYARRNHRTVSN
jgi:ATP synthase protein I